MYSINLNCTINLQDDTGGNIYVAAFEQLYDYDDEDVKTNIINFMLTDTNIEQTEFASSAKDSPLDVNFKIYKAFDAYDGSVHDMKIDTYYSTYALAVDENNNRSLLRHGGRGSINPQPYPNSVYTTATMTHSSGLALAGNIHSTVGFETIIASFTKQISKTDLEAFFIESKAQYRDHITIFDVPSSITKKFTINDIMYNTSNKPLNTHDDVDDYEPFIDTTKTYYIYTFSKNTDPHNTSNIHESVINYTDTSSTPTIMNITAVPRDTSSNVSFEISSNTTYYVSVYALEVVNLNGKFKSHIFERSLKTGSVSGSETISLTLDTYHDNTDSATPSAMVNGMTYHMYIIVKDTISGKYSIIHHKTINTGSPPMIIGKKHAKYERFAESEAAKDFINVKLDIEEESNGGFAKIIIFNLGFNEFINSINDIESQGVKMAPSSTQDYTLKSGTHTLEANIYVSYSTIENYQNNITNDITTDINYTVYFFGNDKLVSENIFQNTIGYIFESKAEAETVRDINTNTSITSNQNTIYSEISPSDGSTLTEKIEITSSGAEANIDISFYNDHKYRLISLGMELTGSNTLKSVTVSSYPTEDTESELSVIAFLTTPDIYEAGVYELKLYYSDFTMKDISFSKFNLNFKTDDSAVSIASLSFNGLVYDDRRPEIKNIVITKEQTGSKIDFTISDYSDVNVSTFISPYLFLIEPELRNVCYNTDNIAPSDARVTNLNITDTLYGSATTMYATKVIVNTINPDSDGTYEESQDYFTYIIANDTSGVPNNDCVYSVENPVNYSVDENPPTLSITTTSPEYYNNGTAIKFEGSIISTSIDNCPFRYKIFVDIDGSLQRTEYDLDNDVNTLNTSDSSGYKTLDDTLNPYLFENQTNISIYLEQTSTGVVIQEGKTYVLTFYCKNSLGISTVSYHSVTIVSNAPVLRHVQTKKVSSTSLSVDVNVNDNYSDVNVYTALFLENPNTHQRDSIDTFFTNNTQSSVYDKTEDVNENTKTIVFDKAFKSMDSDNIIVNVIDTEKVYYIVSYAKENANDPANVSVMLSHFNTNIISRSFVNNAKGQMFEAEVPGMMTMAGKMCDTFDGITGIDVPSVSDLTVQAFDGNEFTFGCVFFPLEVEDDAMIFEIVQNVKLQVDKDDYSLTYIIGTDQEQSTGKFIKMNDWNFITVTINPVTQTIITHLNGVENTIQNTNLVVFRNSPEVNFLKNIKCGIASIHLADYIMKPKLLLEQIDTLSPLLQNVSLESTRVVFDIVDQFKSNINICYYESYYGSVEPYFNFIKLKNHLLANGTTLEAQPHAKTVTYNISLKYSGVDDTTGASNNVRDVPTYAYAYVEDEMRNQRVVYLGIVYNTAMVNGQPVILNINANEGDSKIRNISVSVQGTLNTDMYKIGVYPKDIIMYYHTLDQMKDQIIRNDSPSYNVLNDTDVSVANYFNDTDVNTNTTSMSYDVEYQLVIVVMSVDGSSSVKKYNGFIKSAHKPEIRNAAVSVTGGTNIKLTCDIYEESGCNVYACVFIGDANTRTNVPVSFMKDAKFIHTNGLNIRESDSTDIDFVFEKAHKRDLYHNDTEPTIDGTIYDVCVYVEEINNPQSFAQSVNRVVIPLNGSIDKSPPVISGKLVKRRDNSFEISATVTDNSNVNVKTFVLDTNISDESKLLDFARYAILNETGGDGTYLQDYSGTDHIAKVTKFINTSDITFEKVFTITVNNEIFLLNNVITPILHLFRGQTYTFNHPTGSDIHPFVISEGDSVYTNNGIVTGVDDYTQMRFTVPSTGVSVTYSCSKQYGMGSTISIHDTPTYSNMVDVDAVYYAYMYVEDTSKQSNSSIGQFGGFKIGGVPEQRNFNVRFVSTYS